jgi:hypothetical protein
MHDARVIDQDVQLRIARDQFFGNRRDARWIGNVEFDRFHAGIRPEGFGEVPLAAARDDDFVPELVESLGQATPDARAAAGDEDRVSGEFHIIFFLLLVQICTPVLLCQK